VRTGILCALLLGCGRLGFDPGGGNPDGPPVLDAVDATDDAPLLSCSTIVDLETVALYTFEAGLGLDETGAHDAMVRGVVVPSAGSCGATAARFTTDAYLLVPASPAFDLATSSIELHLRVAMPARAENQTVIARDASGTSLSGHLTTFFNTDGVLLTRLQRGGTSYYRCAPPISPDVWTHLGISVGGAGGSGLRMWVDRVEASLTTALVDGFPVDCTLTVPTGGLAGNDNTWTIGGTNAVAAEGSTDPFVNQFLIDGSIDHVRIRSVPRDFGM